MVMKPQKNERLYRAGVLHRKDATINFPAIASPGMHNLHAKKQDITIT
jgi:hypothetical protein